MNYTSTMRFIELFRQHQALWDRNHADYLNKAERMRQRELIGYTMGMTEVDVGKKICNLRTYYIREMLKRDKAILRGQTSAESYLPRWPYFDALDAFLQDVVRKKRNEYLTAGGSFPEMPYIYTDDHFSDNDNDAVDDFTNDNNDLSRDSNSGGRGGGGGGGEEEHSASGASTTTPFDGNAEGHGNAPPTTKRLKLEPVEFTEASARSGGEGVGVQGFTQPGRKGEDSNLQEKTQTEEQVAEFTGLAGVVVVPAVGRDSGLGQRAGTAGRDSALGQDCSHRVRKSPPFGIQPSLHQSSHVGVPGCSVPRVGPSRGPWPQPHSPFGQSAQGGNAGVGGPGMTAYNNAPTSAPSGTFGGAVGGSPGGGAQCGSATVPAGMVLVEEDDDWLFGRYLVSELKKVKSFKDKQLAKMKMQQIVTYAQLGMDQQPPPAAPDA